MTATLVERYFKREKISEAIFQKVARENAVRVLGLNP